MVRSTLSGATRRAVAPDQAMPEARATEYFDRILRMLRHASHAMTMTTTHAETTRRFGDLLSRREGELREYLRTATDAAIAAGQEPAEARDFKDIAAIDANAAVDSAAADQAMRELGEVMAALRRLEDGTYGICEDCGDPIEEKRLLALPATLYCCACQSVREKPRHGAR
jgi:DnaK suppressor protein